MDLRDVAVAVFLVLLALPGPLFWLVSVTLYPTPDANIGAGLGVLWTLLFSVPAVIALFLLTRRRRGR